MSTGRYVFLPWLRRGIAAQITRPDGGGSPAPRASFRIGVSFNAGTLEARQTSVPLELHGPGDVAGFDARAVIRTWPAPDVFEAESNLFPLIELDQPDLPWRYTPAKATDQERLRPWFCLIALKEGEEGGEARFEPASPNQLFPVVRVVKAGVLPKLGQAWAWAHVQLVGDEPPTSEALRDLIVREPHRAVARLVCPRRLEPRTSYVCCLVPTFQIGRLAGLREKIDPGLDGLAPAWKGDEGEMRLPVYYHWRFQTGGEGDFESLVRRLQPRKVPDTLGLRDMDVSRPGAGLPAATAGGRPLALEGALKSPRARGSAWPDEEKRPWVAKLLALLNLPLERLVKAGITRTVAPPLYGRWHAARQELQPGTQPRWFEEVNSDPRLRIAAGLGTLVVQEQREALLASAWEQVDRIRTINEELRLAQLAREAAVQVHGRHFVSAGDDALLTATAPVHSRIAFQGATVASHLAGSPIPEGLFDPQWRRVSRRLGPLARRQGRAGRPDPDGLLEKLNRGRLSPAPPPPPPVGLCPPPVDPRDGGPVTCKKIDAEPPNPRFHPYDPEMPGGLGIEGQGEPPWKPGEGEGDGPFRDAACKAVDSFNTPPRPDVRHPVDLGEIRDTVVKALDPRDTIGKATADRLKRPPGWNPEDPIEPILAAPEFPQPMYEPLRDLSQEWLLPGVGEIPADTLALLVTNQAFLEAYLVGLSHEMARALLFNEYPTDQRGSYFRQFWDVRGVPGDPEALKDVTALHTWKKDLPLGSNSRRPPGREYLVLLVRGEVLRRYPGTIVYAVEATIDPGTGKPMPGTKEKQPAFRGTLKPDVTFLGFDLTPEVARGKDGHPGWFFVLQEQPAAPRFGLAVGAPAPLPVDRAALTWGHFAADPATLVYLDLAVDLPRIKDATGADGRAARWTRDQVRSADLAYVTQRQPVRVAVHAARMIQAS